MVVFFFFGQQWNFLRQIKVGNNISKPDNSILSEKKEEIWKFKLMIVIILTDWMK
jgi:hypothetical protein